MSKQIKARLEELRLELRREMISQGELIELASLRDYIEDGDVELLEAAGVPESEELTEDEMLEHAVITELKDDLDHESYESLSELLSLLMKHEDSKKLLIGYLSDNVRERWLEGKLTPLY